VSSGKNRRRLGAAALAAALLLAGAARAAEPAAPGARFDTVVIDAGHGGDDVGARGAAGTEEKRLVLAVAQELAARLRAAGLEVVLTRKSDVFVPLEERTARANDARGDLFLSIHANASEDASVSGTETYFLALDASDASAAQVASRENSAFGEAASGIAAIDDPFIALIGDLIATEHLKESSDLARIVQTELGATPLRSRGVKQALFVVLTGVQMPAALVEIGFVTSETDANALAGGGRREIVSALERAVLEFGRRYDARRGAPAPANER
jgi:N-acetylmuramoyl-L-alanine amidase